MNGNGEKNTLRNWLTMILMGLTTWALIGMVQAKQDITGLQHDYGAIERRLNSIENKLDEMILQIK